MKKLIALVIIFLMITTTTFSQIGINADGSSPDPSSMLDVKSSDKGVLIPRMTTAERQTISSPAEGLIVYDTDLGSLCFYRSAAWNQALGDLTGWALKGNSGTNPATDFLGTTDNNALVIKFNNIASGLINSTSTFFGYTAGKDNTGSYSTLIGSGAGWKVTSGNANTALGYQALRNTTTGTTNTALGVYSLFSNTDGGYNVATGHQALYFNSSGTSNTANGVTALTSNNTGSYNTAIGLSALYLNTTGWYNTALGSQADVTVGNLANVTVIGYSAQANASNQVRLGNDNITTFFCKGAWAATTSANPNMTVDEYGQIMRSTATLLGGTGTANQVAFWSSPGMLSGNNNLYWNNASSRLGIGTIAPNQQLELTGSFRFPSTTSSTTGVIYKGGARFMHDYDPPSNNGLNTFLGADAGNFTMTGSNPWDASYNTGVGYQALNAVTSGSDNSGVGYNVLKSNTTGTSNTAVGSGALYTNTTGYGNTATGYGALFSNTTGFYNTGFGINALNENTTGYGNTALGATALLNNTIGLDNTAVGKSALSANTAANRNTALGTFSLYTQSYDNGGTDYYSYNTAVGYAALYLNQPTSTSTGEGNTAVGSSALHDNTTGKNNTAIGYLANVSSGSLENTIVIGYDALANASYQVKLGNTGITSLYCTGAWYSTSTSMPNMVVDNNGQIMRSTATIPSGTGTTNQVAFWSGSGVLSGENDLFWDNTNNRLGIGNATPGQKLEVKGGNLLLSNTGTAGEIRFAEPSGSGTNYTAFRAQIQGGDVTYTLPAADGTSGNVLSTGGGGMLSWITPNAGDITAVGSMTSGDAFADATADNDWLGLGSAAGRIAFDDQATDFVNILNANVGIGTLSPGQLLEVRGGNLLLSNSGTAGEFRFAEPSAGGTNYTALKAQSQTIDINYTLPAADGISGNVLSTDGAGILSWITPSDITAVGSMSSGNTFTDATADDDWLGLGGTAGRIEFDDLATDEVNILSANVGIGTSTPGQKLDVSDGNLLISNTGVAGEVRFAEASGSGTNFTAFKAQAQTANLVYTLPAAGGASGNVLSTSGGANGTLSWIAPTTGDITAVGSMTSGDAFSDATADDDWLGLGSAAGRIEFDDQAIDEVQILNANVGIGTSTPNQQLEITGNFRMPATTATTGIIYSSANPFLHNFGTHNVFLGDPSGNLTLSAGVDNTAIGDSTLSAVSSGDYNVAVGTSALNLLTIANGNTVVGARAGLKILDNGYNTIMGYQAGNQNTADRNTLIGCESGMKNTTGYYNVFLGHQAGYNNTTANNSTALGCKALFTQTGNATDNGLNNTAVGFEALYTNNPTNQFNGRDNVGIGYQSLKYNQTGEWNTSVGSAALYSNSTGSFNTAVGATALEASTGDGNTGIGTQVLQFLSTGDNNTAVGSIAMSLITSGNNNTALGYNSGCTVGSNLTNSTAVGYNAQANANNQVRLGDNNITSLYCKGAYVGTVGGTNRDLYADDNGQIGYIASSARFKDNISDMEEADWLYNLRPVNFTYKSDEIKKKQYGLIAEEVEKINPDFVSYNQDGLVETVSYSQLIAPMLKAIQEQKNTIESMKGDIDIMKTEREQLLRNQEMLMSRLEALEKEHKDLAK